MDIIRITTQESFAADWHTLAVWSFGPLANLPVDADDGGADENDVVLLAVDNGKVVGYLTADTAGVWCVEVHPTHRGKGIARALVAASAARQFAEVCTEAGAHLAEALGLDYEDCR